ncbi:hypothetical protein L227DRAFT_105346 [Lentinus tigrinus ALCF2SS1-6]|uniref:Uncharacterized protein n=1 Tax=Lentinus tigrinus ALCF2SS1-6 TaxID=1328759 RepID=A0A5C2SA75_9APHY|nr:hypothetical protein L227DRAFT_105346 [Lentinus tigrinus ALCF2SS1-6]
MQSVLRRGNEKVPSRRRMGVCLSPLSRPTVLSEQEHTIRVMLTRTVSTINTDPPCLNLRLIVDMLVAKNTAILLPT